MKIPLTNHKIFHHLNNRKIEKSNLINQMKIVIKIHKQILRKKWK